MFKYSNMSVQESPLVVRGFYDKFVAEGAVGVNTDIIAGLQAGFDQQHGLLVVHSDVIRDGESQPLEDGQYYSRLTAAGIGIATLGRRYNEGPDTAPFSALEVDAANQHARAGHVITSLEEHPLRLINQLDVDTTPPLVLFLHRTQPEGSGALVDLRQAVDLGRIAMCVTDSEAARNAYQSVGVPGSLLQVIHNGIDLDRFTPSQEKRDAVRGELQIPADAPTVLYVARFSDEKDPELFVKSARHYLDVQSDGHIIMAGAGLSDKNFELLELAGRHFVDRPDLLARLHALGSRRDIDALHAAADVLALTSRTESYPLCILEAMAAGSIPTSTDVGDTRAMLEGRGIVTSRDPAEIAAAWQEAHARRDEFAITPAERESLGKARMLSAYDALIRSVVRPPAA